MGIISDILKTNKTLKLLILSDILVYGALGFVGPILSIFIDNNLVGGGIFTAGLASTIFLVTHAILQIIFSYKFNPKDGAYYWNDRKQLKALALKNIF